VRILNFSDPVTRTEILTQQKSMTRWTIAQFRPKWSFSGIVFKLMSVHVFVCKWMCVLLVQFFTREGLTGGEQSERERAMSYFVPPCNYGMVEYDLSRSGQCHQLNFPFLEHLHLKTIIYLSHDEPSQHLYTSYLFPHTHSDLFF
jgi:hypothetical protein